MTWQATVLTLFPEMFPGALGVSLIGKALDQRLWSLETRDIREHGIGKHRSVDDTPAGGGAGMVMRADVVTAAVDAARMNEPHRPLIYLTPRGTPLRQDKVQELAKGPGIILLCSRFEGVDERVIDTRPFEEVSLGDFVLAGGETAAMALVEACVRLLPGVLGNAMSPSDESFSAGLLECPQYTRPRSFEGREIPAVLTEGDHAAIARWRRKQAEALTKLRRPDLWALYEKQKS